ncbi:unnamed protein product [Closterium sp. Naga37s-1]|nr:unnamed protein product [Closterium sp. Naga37s-1]
MTVSFILRRDFIDFHSSLLALGFNWAPPLSQTLSPKPSPPFSPILFPPFPCPFLVPHSLGLIPITLSPCAITLHQFLSLPEPHSLSPTLCLLSRPLPSIPHPTPSASPPRVRFQLCDHLPAHQRAQGFVFNCATTFLLTNALKVSIGRPRPHFFIVCFPSGVPGMAGVYGSDGNAQCNGSSSRVMESRVSFPNAATLSGQRSLTLELPYPLSSPLHLSLHCLASVYDSSGNAQCNGSSSSVMESRVSFPSGHTSMSFSGLTYAALFLAAKLQAFMSFAGLTYAALFLAAKLQAFSARGRGQLWRLVPSACCLAGAASVGITRIDDYWHFPFDVFIGGLIVDDYWHFPFDVFIGGLIGLIVGACLFGFEWEGEGSHVAAGAVSMLSGGRCFRGRHSSGPTLALPVLRRLKNYAAWRALPLRLKTGAATVAITRVDDYWHFPFDVFIRGLIAGRLYESMGHNAVCMRAWAHEGMRACGHESMGA